MDARGVIVVLDYRHAGAVDGVARAAPEVVVVALESLGVEPRHLLAHERAKSVVREFRRANCVNGVRLPPKGVVHERDRGRPVGVRRVCEAVPAVVGIRRHDAARPCARREVAAVGICVRRAIAVGVGLGEEEPRGIVVVPRCRVAVLRPFCAVRRHVRHDIERIVGVGACRRARLVSAAPRRPSASLSCHRLHYTVFYCINVTGSTSSAPLSLFLGLSSVHLSQH